MRLKRSMKVKRLKGLELRRWLNRTSIWPQRKINRLIKKYDIYVTRRVKDATAVRQLV